MDDTTFLNVINTICQGYNCVIDWGQSDIDKRILQINGADKDLSECAVAIENALHEHIV